MNNIFITAQPDIVDDYSKSTRCRRPV